MAVVIILLLLELTTRLWYCCSWWHSFTLAIWTSARFLPGVRGPGGWGPHPGSSRTAANRRMSRQKSDI